MENITKKNIFLAFIVLLVAGVYISHWIHCNLPSAFFFSAEDTKLRVIFDIRSNQSTIPLVAKLFHNKITQGSVDIFNAYVHFWDIRFLLFLLSPLTIFGIALRIFYLVKWQIKLSSFERIFAALILLFPLVILFHLVPSQFSALIIFSMPLVLLSIRGLFLYSNKYTYAWIVFVGVLIISVWFLLILHLGVMTFCQT